MKLSIVLVSIIMLAGVAAADNKEKADALFKKGKQLMGEKRYADACEAFEKSHKLDPGIGSQLNIGKCYEEWGKIGRAFVAYQAAEKLAKDQKDSREAKIHELVVALEPNVPHLTINLPPDAPKDLKVTLDNRPVTKFGESFVVDPGPHLIEWSVKGGQKKDKVVPLDRGADSSVTLDIPKSMLAKVKTKPEGDPQPPDGTPPPITTTEPEPDPGRNMRLGGIAMAGGGLLAIGISSFMTLSARGKYNDAIDAHCMGMKNMCDMTGLEITRDARGTANKATVVFIIGVALAGGGAAMYFLAPKKPGAAESAPAEAEQAFYISPSVTPDSLGVVFGGSL